MQLEIGIFVKIPKIKDTNVVELELRLSALRNRFVIFVTFTTGIPPKYVIKINAYGVREISKRSFEINDIITLYNILYGLYREHNTVVRGNC